MAAVLSDANPSTNNHTANNQMKSYLIPTLALGLLVSSAVAQDKPDLTNPKQKTSYAIGVNIGSSLKAENLDLDARALAAGISDAMGGKPALTPEEVQ